ncbi:hypothetical protein SAMN04488063_2958 [Halopelagius inordinatus]|uniref:Uncharacterized protein n=1 Tax=Halopelagius inordinatus TaxID=553467 RepID=A0A1I2UQF6_9EURY|nr:hypothetical protein [Halopelagius inordinatus]SFG79230.1 hypothetical protein SAMN04488063_2958 [Halopelagius inordinatus]
MGVVSARTFERWLRRLDSERLRGFVSDLYAAAGRDVRRRADGTLVLAESGQTVVTVDARLRLRTPRIPADADIVVAASPSRRLVGRAAESGVTLLGPTDLREMALYGVDRDDCERLFRRYFDESPVVERSNGGADGRTPDAAGADADAARGSDGRWDPVREEPLSSLLVVALAALVVAAALLGPVGPGADDADEPAVEAGTAEAADADDGLFPPGVGPTGVVSAETLATAHADAVTGRSYQLIVRQSGSGAWAGRTWDRAYQRADVAGPTNYHYSVTGYRSTDDGDDELVQYSMYADGRDNYVFIEDGDNRSFVRYSVRTDEAGHGPFENRAARAIERYLDATRTNVTRENWSVQPYRIVATGTPESVDDAERIVDYRAEAHVGADGFVSRLTVAYGVRIDDEVENVSFRMEYVQMDVQTVRPPSWYDEARNATLKSEPTPVRASSATPRNESSSASPTPNGSATETTRADETARPTATSPTAASVRVADRLAVARFGRLAPRFGLPAAAASGNADVIPPERQRGDNESGRFFRR